jgi:hypothetical protein
VKRFVLRALLITLTIALTLTALAYATDSLLFRYRVARNRNPFSQVMVYAYDAVPQKSGKTQFIFHDPQLQTCVNALFPHAGDPPCWYLRRHTEARTNY